MSKLFTLEEVHALELSAAENAKLLEHQRIVKELQEYAIALRKYNPISGDERAKMIEYAIERIEPSRLIKGENE